MKTEVNICRSSHSYTFVKAYTYLSTVIVRIYPYANPSSGRFRKRSIYTAISGDRGGGRGGRFNVIVHDIGRGGRGGRGIVGYVQGGCGGGRGAHENGIDISDITRYFEDSEWAALSNDTSKRITEDPVRTKFLSNKKRCTTISASAVQDNENRFISQIIAGFQNAIRNESGLAGVLTCLPNNGSRAQVSSTNRGSDFPNINNTEEQSVFIYDHLGNLVTKT